MRSSKPWLIAVAVLFVFVFCASSAMATTTYVRGYVKPSGDGADCATVTPGTNCVGGSGSTLLVNDGTLSTPDVFNLFQIGVTSGATVNFTFTSLPGLTDFQVVACGYGNSGELAAGIYTSSEQALNLPCTALGDPFNNGISPNFTDPANFITDNNCTIANTLCYTFSGTNLPFSWVFSEISTGPTLISLTETFGQPPVSAPEPASLSLLAAGLIGLGIFRRKRSA
jgi:PEP-CTERM motif